MAIFIAVVGPAANKFLLTSSPLILIPRYVWIWIIFLKKPIEVSMEGILKICIKAYTQLMITVIQWILRVTYHVEMNKYNLWWWRITLVSEITRNLWKIISCLHVYTHVAIIFKKKGSARKIQIYKLKSSCSHVKQCNFNVIQLANWLDMTDMSGQFGLDSHWRGQTNARLKEELYELRL